MVLGILILGLIVFFLAYMMKRKNNEKMKTDYYAFFVMGIIWLGAGIPLKNYALSVMGLVFMAIGLKHKDEWKENRQSWDNLSPADKKVKMLLIGFLTLILVVGIIFFLLAKN